MLSATKIRIYPTKAQKAILATQFGCARFVWNNALAENQRAYKETGRGMGYHALAVQLPKMKKELEWLKQADAQVLQQSLQNLAAAFDGFFAKRGKYPKFKNKHGRQSIQYPQRVKIDGNRIRLPKVGSVKSVVHRPIEGKIKTVTISLNPSGHYYASVLTENGVIQPEVSTKGKAIGVDLGLTDFAVTSDGSKFRNARHIKREEKNLKRKQKKLSRKVKGSKSRDRARLLVAKVHERIYNRRKDFLHKLSHRLVNENQVICLENLNVKGMMKNHCLAKAVSDVGWSEFVRQLTYKAAKSGKCVIKVDRFFPSSKACSSCGVVKDKLPLDIRQWTCDCGETHDRDVKAAKNIRNEGIKLIAGGAPVTAVRGSVSRRKKLGASRSARAVENRSPSL